MYTRIPYSVAAWLAAAWLATGCLPYLTTQRDAVRIPHIDMDASLDIAAAHLARPKTGRSLGLWVLRDQDLTAAQAQRVAALYASHADGVAATSSFDAWHLTWAVANMYRLGDAAVRAALEPAYRDARRRAAQLHRLARTHVLGDTIYMGDAHGGGRAFAKRHVVAPGNPRYLQSKADYDWVQGRSDTHDPAWGGTPTSRDFTPPGWVRQPSFVYLGGMLNKGEHAAVLTVDAELLPPAVMAGWRYGLLYWWEVGVDVGGDKGVFQALVSTKMENFKTARSERFYWGTQFRTGYKHHVATLRNDVEFDDRSWVFIVENTFALRFGARRHNAVFLGTQFYVDKDLHVPRRQTDYYLAPALLGYERVLGWYANGFIAAGMVYSFNGMELADGEIAFERSWFPAVVLGFGYRTGDRTATYYGRPTRHMARGGR